MDQFKFHNDNRDMITKQVLDHVFEPLNLGSYNPIWHCTTDTYISRKHNIILALNPFGTHIHVNPTKYLKGTNIEQISKQELPTFYEEISEYIHSDIYDYTVTGFDFNCNLEMNYTPDSYFPMFDTLARYDKTDYWKKTGITFENDSKSLVLYGKIMEQRKRKVYIPPQFEHKNLLRVELRLKQDWQKTINLRGISKPQDLLKPNIYNNIIKELHHMFKKVRMVPTPFKTKRMNLQKPINMDVQDFQFVKSLCSHKNSFKEYLTMLEIEYKKLKLTRNKYYRRRQHALQLWNELIQYGTNDNYDQLNELRFKMDQKVNSLYC